MPPRDPKLKVDGPRKLNLGCGDDVRPLKDGWVNLDGYFDHPDVIKHDLVKFPYPFADNAFDVVFASHVLEHIPPIFHAWKGVQRDALFTVFEELHRILKPGGKLHILVPRGNTPLGWAHPQHYRQFHPDWFKYLAGENWEKMYHGARWNVEHIGFNRLGYRWPWFWRMGKSGLGVTQHLCARLPFTRPLFSGKHEMEVLMTAVKS